MQEALGVEPVGTRYEACSAAVGSALGPDVMQSVKRLVPDLLEAYPVLLYQGGRCLRLLPGRGWRWAWEVMRSTSSWLLVCWRPVLLTPARLPCPSALPSRRA